MALFGQLYLQKGKWNGQQIIPAEWIEASTRSYSVYDLGEDDVGYGMLWKIYEKTDERKAAGFFHTGSDVHLLGVYPELNLVLVHRVDTEKEVVNFQWWQRSNVTCFALDAKVE